jgi:hypothetical protein
MPAKVSQPLAHLREGHFGPSGEQSGTDQSTHGPGTDDADPRWDLQAWGLFGTTHPAILS